MNDNSLTRKPLREHRCHFCAKAIWGSAHFTQYQGVQITHLTEKCHELAVYSVCPETVSGKLLWCSKMVHQGHLDLFQQLRTTLLYLWWGKPFVGVYTHGKNYWSCVFIMLCSIFTSWCFIVCYFGVRYVLFNSQIVDEQNCSCLSL